MNDIIVGKQREGVAYFCPKCHNPVDVQFQLGIVGAHLPVHCTACNWDGDQSELAQSSFKHEFKSDDEIAQAMMVDLRNLLSKTAAVTYGRFLLKWGFLDQPIRSEQLGRYMMEIAKTVTTAVIQTRKTLAEEAARERISR
jgi:hypothetical protein